MSIIIGMTIYTLLLSPYHFVLHYVMLCDHVTTMRTGTERGVFIYLESKDPP